MAKTIRPFLLLPLCLLVAWLFDYLFWGKAIGVSFPVFVVVLLAAGFWLARRSGLRPAALTLWLLIPILFLASVSAFRTEPLTVFTSRLVTVLLLGVFSLSFLGGQWTQYGFLDYGFKLLGLLPLGLGSWMESRPKPAKNARKSFWTRIAPVLRGVVIALPLLLFFSFLLSSADPFFGQWMGDLFIEFDNLPEYIIRALLIVLIAYALVAAYMFAINQSRKQALIGSSNPVVPIAFGWTEAITVLGAVNLLFGVFVVVQFRYFFGGLVNVVEGPTGFTFAEYARRGFGELVVVALSALGLFVILSAVTKRSRGAQQTWFSGLGIALFALVAVILVSAFERLLLLEEAYGFTRMRTYPHVFMVWLGILLLAIVVLEALDRQRSFALATMLAIVGFTATLPILNVDAFIANTNIQRSTSGLPLDAQYLGTLSSDAIPAMVSSSTSELSEELNVALTCYLEIQPVTQQQPWQSWNLSTVTAGEQLRGVSLPSLGDVECQPFFFD